jgi:hypothetical protein
MDAVTLRTRRSISPLFYMTPKEQLPMDDGETQFSSLLNFWGSKMFSSVYTKTIVDKQARMPFRLWQIE